MSLKVAVQMDPIDAIRIAGDTTFALLLEAQRRGHELHYYTPDHLSMRRRDRSWPGCRILSVKDVQGEHAEPRGRAVRTPLDAMDVGADAPGSAL